MKAKVIILIVSVMLASTLFEVPSAFAADNGCYGGGGPISVQCVPVAPDITDSFTALLHSNAEIAYKEFGDSMYMGVGSLVIYVWMVV